MFKQHYSTTCKIFLPTKKISSNNHYIFLLLPSIRIEGMNNQSSIGNNTGICSKFPIQTQFIVKKKVEICELARQLGFRSHLITVNIICRYKMRTSQLNNSSRLIAFIHHILLLYFSRSINLNDYLFLSDFHALLLRHYQYRVLLSIS